MKPSKRISPRQFLRSGTAAAGVLTIVPRHVLGGPGHLAPSDKVNVAVVGVGGRGRQNVHDLFDLKDCQIIAVADPAESFSTANFYYKSTGGRAPVAAEIEKQY